MQNNSLKAILIFTIFIILFSISFIFLNFENKETNIVLANKNEINEEVFKPRDYKLQNDTNTNHLGGSKDDILLNSFFINNKIYVLFKTNSKNHDLIQNKENNDIIAIGLFTSEGSLVMTYIISTTDEYLTSFLINDTIYIYKNNTLGIEIIFDTEKNETKTTTHKNLFSSVLFVDNEIIYIYKKNDNKIININDNLFTIPQNYFYKNQFKVDNKNYLIFSDGNNQQIFNIQDKTFVLSFDDCEILEISSTNDEILILFNTNNTIVFSKFLPDFKEVFSIEIKDSGTDLIKFSTKNNGYLIYTIKDNTILTTFICNHGDTIYKTETKIESLSSILEFQLLDNGFLVVAKTKNDNFYATLLDTDFAEKKYMALSTSTIYNFNFKLIDNKLHLLVSTDFANFEFADNFSKQDIFLFIK